MLYQIDVKSVFLSGYIEKDIYVDQPLCFVDFEHPNHVYKLKKALHDLKQAPRSSYERFVGSSDLRIIKKGGVELIINEPLLIKKLILLNVTKIKSNN